MKIQKKILISLFCLILIFACACGQVKQNKLTLESNKNSSENNISSKSKHSLKDNCDKITNVSSDKDTKCEKNNEKQHNNENINKNTEKIEKTSKSKDSIQEIKQGKIKVLNDKKNVNKCNKDNKDKILVENASGKKHTGNSIDKSKNTFKIIVSSEMKGYTNKQLKVIDERQITIENNKNLMSYLRDNFKVVENGGYIYEVLGIKNVYSKSKLTDQQKKNKILGVDWFIYLNDKKVSVGANDLYPKMSDEIIIDIHEWDKNEFLKK